MDKKNILHHIIEHTHTHTHTHTHIHAHTHTQLTRVLSSSSGSTLSSDSIFHNVSTATLYIMEIRVIIIYAMDKEKRADGDVPVIIFH